MNLGKVFLFLLCLFLFIPADSRPAHRGVIALEQPDACHSPPQSMKSSGRSGSRDGMPVSSCASCSAV